jgi:hypothetical protein
MAEPQAIRGLASGLGSKEREGSSSCSSSVKERQKMKAERAQLVLDRTVQLWITQTLATANRDMSHNPVLKKFSTTESNSTQEEYVTMH